MITYAVGIKQIILVLQMINKLTEFKCFHEDQKINMGFELV